MQGTDRASARTLLIGFRVERFDEAISSRITGVARAIAVKLANQRRIEFNRELALDCLHTFAECNKWMRPACLLVG